VSRRILILLQGVAQYEAQACMRDRAAGARSLIPHLLHRFRIDPAVSSDAFVTTVTDVVGYASFLGIATLRFGLGRQLTAAPDGRGAKSGGQAHVRPSRSFAAATTWSGSNPNFLCSSLRGADAPNVFMPMTRPDVPTYRSHPRVPARHPHTGTTEGLGASASSRDRTRSAEKDLKESD
jgi:hypothetical protein